MGCFNFNSVDLISVCCILLHDEDRAAGGDGNIILPMQGPQLQTRNGTMLSHLFGGHLTPVKAED
jgi:hypothetical protein